MISLIKKKINKNNLKNNIVVIGRHAYDPKKQVRMEITPADKGIEFILEDGIIPVNYHSTCDLGGQHTTALKCGENVVITIEHLLSAMFGAKLYSAKITLSGGNTPPVLDFSAEKYSFLLRDLNKKLYEAEVVKINEDIFFKDDKGSLAIIRPADHFSISALIQFGGLIGEQYYNFDPEKESYLDVIAKSRTFIRASCSNESWQKIREKIPVLPVKRENSPIPIFDGNKWVVPPTEPLENVKHKILDAIGDLMTLGLLIEGSITLIRPGHDFNRQLVNYLGKMIDEKK